MKLKIKNKNILTLDELDSKEIEHLLELAIELKKEQKKGHEKPILQNKTLAMIFENPLHVHVLVLRLECYNLVDTL